MWLFKIIAIHMWHLLWFLDFAQPGNLITLKNVCLTLFLHDDWKILIIMYEVFSFRTAAWRSCVLHIYVHIKFYCWYPRTLIYLEKTLWGLCLCMVGVFTLLKCPFITLNCCRATLTSIQRMTSYMYSVRLQEAFRSQGLSVREFPSGEPLNSAPPPASTSTPLSFCLLPNPPFLCSGHPSPLLYLPPIICPCPPSAAVLVPLL